MENKASAASGLLWEQLTNGTVMGPLPDVLRPMTRAEGYAAQADMETRSTHPRAGWKIAATSLAGQQHIAVDGPMAGRLLAERVYPPGTVLSLATNRMKVVEPEFAFRFGRPVPVRAEPYSAAEALEFVSSLHLALEVPDSRFANFAEVGAPSLIADNACARDLIVGAQVDADWRAMDLAAHTVQCTVGSRYMRDGIGSNVLGDPREALAWCVNEVVGLGIELQPGELIITGVCTVPLEVEAGDLVTADYGVLGTISVRLV